MSNENHTYVFRSLICVFLALIVFVLVWVAADAALKILDTVRNNRNLIQDFAREVGVPAFAAYVGLMSANAIIKRYNKHIVFYLFSTIVIALIVLSLVIQIPVAREAGISTYDLVLTALSGVTSVGAAYLTYKSKLK